MIDFKVSVIIPVYNAENFLEKSVLSAVNLKQVGEIILIEDCSPDHALDVALRLEKEFDKVKVYQHPDKGNYGAGASRNLGIKMASYPFISFLDADDYYLPSRFSRDEEIFMTIKNCDGVYNAVGTFFKTEKAKQTFFDGGWGYQEILTLNNPVEPEDLFSVLFHQDSNVKGEFHTNGITLKKTVFEKVGFFNTKLRLRQDIHLWRRLAGFCNLYSGEIGGPVAMRVIHDENRMTKRKDHLQYIDIWWQSLKDEFKIKGLDKNKYAIFEQAYFNHYAGDKNKFKAFKALLMNVIKKPKLFAESYGNFDFNFWKVFGKNKWTIKFISFKNKLFT